MGGGWLGGGWQGGGWQGGGWQGGGWQGGGWSGGTGGGGPHAMRYDRPLVADNLTPDGNQNPGDYPLHAWDSDLLSLTFLPDFFTANVGGQSWQQAITVNPFPGVILPGGVGGANDDKIDDLRILAVTERPEAMGEILDQHQNQQLCFMQLLMMSDTSHRATFFLMKVAARVGEAVMMHLKRQYKRPRPSQYYPALYPPVPVPGHASYPAGHALIAQLTAKVLIDVTNPAGAPPSPYEKSLLALADRIGRNRVIAGLHFWSDIREGAAAGNKIHTFLRGMPKPNVGYPLFNYHTALNNARAEWNLPPLP